MERFLFKTVEVWLVAVLVLILLILMLAFGVVVRGVGHGSDRYGATGRIAYAVASLPSEARRELRMLFRGDLAGMATRNSDRFAGKGGWTFFDGRRESGLDGYLLFSRHDGDVGHHVFELVDLEAGETVHRIGLDANVLFADAQRGSRLATADDWRPERFRAFHPLALEDGDFLVRGTEPR